MYKPSNPDELDFTDTRQLFDILSSIAMLNDTQGEVTDALTELRNAAVRAHHEDEFEEALVHSNEILQGDVELRKRGIILRYKYTFDDFAAKEMPYRDVFFQPSQFLRNQRLEVLTVQAKEVGFSSFKKTYKLFCENMRKIDVTADGAAVANPTDFPLQPLELNAGEWRCNYEGICKETPSGTDIACRHPIMPIERLVNIDTGEEKLKVAYYKGRYWREHIVGKKELFDASKIMQLAAYGVSVTSKTAKTLSEFLCDIESLNYDIIPERESVSRLGYIGTDGNFSPYVDGIIFDGDANYSSIYSAITEHGDYNKWFETALKCRNDNVTAQIMLAASFASILIGKIGCLSFFVHLWGVESGTGKTVALMLAASVWGNPSIGQYVQTFNATQVGHEKTAAFLNNIPMCIDELQLSKDSHGRSKFDVYQLSQGVGRTRGNKGGGIDKTPTWALCVLTTGESPITSDSSGAGAVNRVIDIECKAADSVIKDGYSVSAALKQNYGFAGRKFVEAMTDEEFDKAKQRYADLFKELSSGATTEKQASSAALIILADELADKFIFKTGKYLDTSQITEFLKSKASVSAGERGYAFMCDWVGVNSNKFLSRDDGNSGEIYGKISGNWVYINSTVFRNAAKSQGFDDRALLSWLKTNGLLMVKKKDRLTIYTSTHNVKAQYVVMKLPEIENDYTDDYEELL